jgi:predicted nuclease of predicted toxin-antitoxin system
MQIEQLIEKLSKIAKENPNAIVEVSVTAEHCIGAHDEDFKIVEGEYGDLGHIVKLQIETELNVELRAI